MTRFLSALIDKFICNTWVGSFINKIIAFVELKLMIYYHGPTLARLIKQICTEDKPLLLKPSEVLVVYSFAALQTSIEGDYAEVGVFKGATAKAMCEAKGNKPLHLFDTFEGLPEVDKIDRKFKTGMFRADYEHVRKKLSGYKNVHLYKGLFPGTAEPVSNNKFSYVHLDVDTYESTKACIEFFYPRLAVRGVILSHDYHAQGVKKAFDDFFKDKPEKIIQLPMSQCFIIKL